MKWIENLKSIANKNSSGNCPFCNSINTDFAYQPIEKDDIRGYGAVWCDDCKKAFSLSRVDLTNEKENIKPIPEGLIF